MKSTKNKKSPFTIEDFEKGLMLAGLVTPGSFQELYELEALKEHESAAGTEKSAKNNTFFKRVTLAAEIVSQMHSEPTFGRIKFQKLVYLCENAACMGLNDRYHKQAAGPFDNKFMHSIEQQFKKNNWFKVERKMDGKYNRSVYIPLGNETDYKKYYNAYFLLHKDRIQYIIDLFKTEKTDKTEIVATLYACIVELNKENISINEDSLLQKFYGWSEAKQRFKAEEILNTWNWMQEKQIVPNP